MNPRMWTTTLGGGTIDDTGEERTAGDGNLRTVDDSDIETGRTSQIVT